MLPKPDDCIGCPFYGDGRGFVPDELPESPAQVVFVCQNPGEVEEVQGRPLVGPTGQMLRTRFVARHLPGVLVTYANIVKCRVLLTRDGKTFHSNNLPPLGSPLWRRVVEQCSGYLKKTLEACPNAIVVPMGEHAALALTGRKAKAMLHLRGTLLVNDDARK